MDLLCRRNELSDLLELLLSAGMAEELAGGWAMWAGGVLGGVGGLVPARLHDLCAGPTGLPALVQQGKCSTGEM